MGGGIKRKWGGFSLTLQPYMKYDLVSIAWLIVSIRLHVIIGVARYTPIYYQCSSCGMSSIALWEGLYSGVGAGGGGQPRQVPDQYF